MDKSLRYRVNVSTSVKGIKTWECTVDMVGTDEQGTSLPSNFSAKEVLEKSDALVKELERRYPAPTE